MNIAFPFVILMSQDYGKEASSITVFEKFSQYWEQKLTIFVDVLLEKTEDAQLGYHTRKSRKT